MPPDDVPASASIVLATQGEAVKVLQGSLAGLSLATATTFEQARRLLDAHTPLVLCDCHFDDGRMYDLLRWMKASPSLATVPFLAVRLRQGELDDAMYESVKIATRALGADGFVDLHRWQLRHGKAEAAQRLVRCIQALAAGEPIPDPDAG